MMDDLTSAETTISTYAAEIQNSSMSELYDNYVILNQEVRVSLKRRDAGPPDRIDILQPMDLK